ncbi:MAG: hypothetical protein HY591_04790 [Candidatus Omnitrophica bacterium]|nr:hypothetical protein [Candidatus Omnitrophota bacterium]
MNRKCPRTLDKPILLFGLELEDVALVSLVVGVGSLLIGPMLPGTMAIAGWMVLLRFKRDKPPGYVLHWLYAQGFQLPGLIRPIKEVKHYAANHSPRLTLR